MKRTIILIAILCPFLLAAQPRIREKRYPSLLWEITGNGVSKASYLFGTMHVSSKLAFHLADSFYIGIRRADVVALETNPESWQEDMNKYDLGSIYGQLSADDRMPTTWFRRNSISFSPYIPSVEAALSSNPSSINNLLYRSYGNESADFEEDTYLDMYIYQCGKKWGKQVAGVEHYGESMKLMAEAYRDAAADKSRRPVRYDGDEDFSGSRLQEAYRSGNLDWLDSINKYNSQSDAFDEKFMYRRNEIQAASIDSILRTGQSLFVGVGAAHLPGNRGVIEMLRAKGYKLRPVKMGARDSDHKTQVEKLRVPVIFHTQFSEDSFFRADIPGRFYPAGEEENITQQQYADMSNGSYYIVTRIQTNAWMWGHSPERVRSITDSLLYENIPGKIIKKSAITRDGYPGIEIINRTRRGDMQRYNIYFTPYEILFFKMSGTAGYVTTGTEADRFFSSIRLRTYPAGGAVAKKWSPAYGGFSVAFPHQPFATNRERWTFDASEPGTNNYYRVIRNDIHQYGFTDQDSFDLSMMDESFASSEFIDRKVSGRYTVAGGYPAYDARYKDKWGALYQVRFLIQGPHYYTVLARSDRDSARQTEFINSFGTAPYKYGAIAAETDTSLSFTVRTPFINRSAKEKIDVTEPSTYGSDEEPGSGDGSLSRMRVVANDSTGEIIMVNYARMSDYETMKDSALLREFSLASWKLDSSRIVRSAVTSTLPGGGRSFDVVLSDTGSSRTIRMKVLYTSGHAFVLQAEGDTLSVPSTFITSFFDTFQPADSLKGPDPFASKTGLFFKDLFSSDTTLHKKALNGLSQVDFTDDDLPALVKAINTFSYQEKDYLSNKKRLVGKLGDLQSDGSTDFLKQLYAATADTLDLQHEVLEQLLAQQTLYSYRTFRDIIVRDPPVLAVPASGVAALLPPQLTITTSGTYDGSFLSGLYDSLPLTAQILPDLLQLMDLEEYEPAVRNLVAVMADSSLVKPKVYASWYPRFMLQAKQLLKMQQIGEKQEAIARAERMKDPAMTKEIEEYQNNVYENIPGPNILGVYASLLLPFYEKQEAVRSFIPQLFATNDEDLKYDLLLQLIKQHKPVPDSMLGHFAIKDSRRLLLYKALREMGRTDLFPPAEKSQVAMARSLLMQTGRDTPDSLVYLDRLPATIGRRTGVVLFFKYKASKYDATWMIANGGLMPADSTLLFFEGDDLSAGSAMAGEGYNYYGDTGYQLGSAGNTKLNEDIPVAEQLRNELKKILFSTHASGRMFYYGQPERKYYEDATAEVVTAEEQ